MADYQLYTERLRLIPLSPEWLEAMKTGPEKFKLLTGYSLPDPFTEFPESMDQIILHLKENPGPPPWLSYALIRPNDGVYIGQGGYKGPPTADGTVEIGYEIAKGYRSNGYANEVIRFLVREAFRHPEVRTIRAHTLPRRNESNHLLIKNKFVFQSLVVDPDDGPVWQWELKKDAYRFAVLQES